MTPELLQLLLLAVGAMVAGFVQGLSGFAFAMVAMSFWVWGVEPRVATVMAVFGGLTGQVIAAVSTRRPLRLPVLAPFLLGGLVGVPLGIWLLPQLDARWFKLVFGLLFVLWCPAMLFARQLPKLTFGGRVADGCTGIAGGVMSGISGFAGALPTLWCTLRGYDKDLQRTIIQNFNLAALAMSMAGYLAAGMVTRPMLPMLGVVALAMLVPVLLGARLYVGLSELAFRRIVLVLLTCSGVAMLSSAAPALLR